MLARMPRLSSAPVNLSLLICDPSPELKISGRPWRSAAVRVHHRHQVHEPIRHPAFSMSNSLGSLETRDCALARAAARTPASRVDAGNTLRVSMREMVPHPFAILEGRLWNAFEQ